MIILLVLFGILLIAADQFIKIWAVDVLKPVKVMDFIKFGDFEILGLRYQQFKRQTVASCCNGIDNADCNAYFYDKI